MKKKTDRELLDAILALTEEMRALRESMERAPDPDGFDLIRELKKMERDNPMPYVPQPNFPSPWFPQPYWPSPYQPWITWTSTGISTDNPYSTH